MPEKVKNKERIIVYIDGFNLYFGMTESYNNTKWLDVHLLAKNLLKGNQELVAVKYFTARISNHTGKQIRQNKYLEAIRQMGAHLIYGQYNSNVTDCRNCGHSWSNPDEKMTDVNIACSILMDAVNNAYDAAILISGDSDLVPPINAVHEKFKDKRVMVFFPPNRQTVSLKNAAKGSFIIGRKKLQDSQLPLELTKPDGYVLKKPTSW